MMKKKVFFLLFLLLSTSVLMDGCGSQESSAPSQEAENKKSEWVEEENGEMKMNVNVNGQDFTATLEQNSAVSALVQMMENGPVTLHLSDYAGFNGF